MGWVVSKPLKQNVSGNKGPQDTFDYENVGSTIPIEYVDGSVKENNISLECKLDTPPCMPRGSCDILIIDHEMEFFSVSNTIKSPIVRAESLFSIPFALDDHVELSSKSVEGSHTNFALSTTSKIMMCPSEKSKSSKLERVPKNNENRPKSFSKSKKSKQVNHIKKEKKNKIISSKTFSQKPNLNILKCNKGSANESCRLPLTKQKFDLSKPIKTVEMLISKRNTIGRNSNPILPSLKVMSAKDSRKKTPNNSEKKTTIQKKKTAKISNNLMSLNLEKIKMKDEEVYRNASPGTVEEGEKQLFTNNFEIKETGFEKEIPYLPSFIEKKRPATAFSSSNNPRESFDVIIEDFNRKLEKIIKENHMMNCLCENCNKETNTKNKTTAGKITFFFLKKYGNFGKFILARLNEFLDNVYEISPNPTDSTNCRTPIGNSFPLPCNRKDIGYEGDLKPYSSFLKEDFIPKSKNSKSKLPKLILNSDKFHYQNTNNETKNVKNRKFQNQNSDEKPEKLCELRPILPPLKPASSIMNFSKTSNSDKNNLIYQTLDLNSEQSISGLLNILYDENIVQSCVSGSGQTGNGISTVGFENPLVFGQSSEEEITVMANKIIDDLWKSTYFTGCRTKSIISD